MEMQQIIDRMLELREESERRPPNTRMARLLYGGYLRGKPLMQTAFEKHYGCRRTRSRFSLESLARGSRLHKYDPPTGYPFWDHQEHYNRKGKPWCIVVHTYAPLSTVAARAQGLAQRGLVCSLPPVPAWHNPFHCLPVMITRLEEAPEDGYLLLESMGLAKYTPFVPDDWLPPWYDPRDYIRDDNGERVHS